MAKICSCCGEAKNETEFHKRVASPDGLQGRCKDCVSISSLARYKANRDKALAYAAAYRDANAEQCKRSQSSWREANKEKIMSYNAQYHALHSEERKKYYREWNKANPKAACVYNHNRNARKRGKLSKDIASRLFVLQQGKCVCCRKPLGKNYHLDHVVPLALGGTNTDDNIQLLRAECNMQKHTKHPAVFMQLRGFLI